MNDTQLARIVNGLLDRPVAFMTDQQLAQWIEACQVMERKVRPAKARRNWSDYRAEAESEHQRRVAIDAEERETNASRGWAGSIG